MEPIINLDDPVGKTVGRRRAPAPLWLSTREKLAKERWRNAGYGVRVPRGVHRFQTYEEADAWLMKNLTRIRES